MTKTDKIKLTIKKTNDPDFYLVKAKGLKSASENSQKKDFIIKKQKRYLNFYKKQNLKLRSFCKSIKE